jgi:hypothetical protein
VNRLGKCLQEECVIAGESEHFPSWIDTVLSEHFLIREIRYESEAIEEIGEHVWSGGHIIGVWSWGYEYTEYVLPNLHDILRRGSFARRKLQSYGDHSPTFHIQ